MNDITPPEGSGQKSLQTIRTGHSLQPIYPQSIEEVYRFAQMAVMSGTLKPVTRNVKTDRFDRSNKPIWEQQTEGTDATIARGAMIIMQGLEIGMPPLQALQLIAVINGRCVVHSEGVPAVLLAHRFKIKEWWVDAAGVSHETADKLGDPNTWTDKVAAYCQITRPDGQVITRSFSVGEAKTAKLWDRQAKVTKGYGTDRKEVENDSAWFRFPTRMLPARARGFACKDGAADAMRGMMVAEEAIDTQRLQEEREEPRTIENTTPQIPFNISLDLAAPTATAEPDLVPEREQEPAQEPDPLSVLPSGNNSEPIEDIEVVPDDEQVLSRATEARLILELGSALAAAQEIAEVKAIEKRVHASLSVLSEDGRDALIEAIETAKKRLK